jgi:Domain of unknown function (DUF1905)/Bacteriocin-protection, YdeI or OmpD-Associated
VNGSVTSKLQVFSEQIYKISIIRYVNVPAEVSRALKASGPHVAVRGTVEGVPLATTMVSRGNSCYRLAISGDIRKKLRIDVGATVQIALERDRQSREPALPHALVLALRESPEAQAVFREMTVALRRQIVRYIVSAKQQATLERRVAAMVRRVEKMPSRRKIQQKA